METFADDLVRIGRELECGRHAHADDVLLSGTHEPGSSHYELLRAFAPDQVLQRASGELETRGYRTHEFGNSVWLERAGSGRAMLASGDHVSSARCT